jgi:deoxyribodipyrimidine photo-lyase
MQRAQRGRDNPALNHAIELGNALKQPVLAVFGLTADYPEAERRHSLPGGPPHSGPVRKVLL